MAETNRGVAVQDRQVDWLSVSLFFVLACAVSWPFFWWSRIHPSSYAAWALLPDSFKGLPFMWGPGLAVLVLLCVNRLRGRQRRAAINFHGGAWVRSAIFYIVPLLALATLEIETRSGRSFVGVATLTMGTIGFAQVLGEELGWRGWLQDALSGLSPGKRYLLIGLMWEFWHARVLIPGNSLSILIPGQVVMLFATVGLAFGIGWATDRTRSLAVAVTLHAWVNIPLEFPGWRTAAVAAASLPLWAWLIWTWPRAEEQSGPI